ncbi:MAG: hypothetical protein ACJA2D_002438 [Pseudohongiellaceae bacterium]|jgi:hypothetical protein
MTSAVSWIDLSWCEPAWARKIMLFNNALYFHGAAHQLGALTNAGWSLKQYLSV